MLWNCVVVVCRYGSVIAHVMQAGLGAGYIRRRQELIRRRG